MEHIGRHLEKDRKEGLKLGDVGKWAVDKDLEKWLLDEGIIDVGKDGQWRIGNGRPVRYTHDNDEREEKET
jgi:hypothetical protein